MHLKWLKILRIFCNSFLRSGGLVGGFRASTQVLYAPVICQIYELRDRWKAQIAAAAQETQTQPRTEKILIRRRLTQNVRQGKEKGRRGVRLRRKR